MRLYLVRHGEAAPKDVDPERPLTEAGRREVQRVANLLSAAGVRVARVVHSGKTRAEQTAVLLELAVGARGEPAGGLAPDDPVEPWAAQLASATEDLMIVGHLPFVSVLGTRLLTGREDPPVLAFSAGAVACLEHAERGRWGLAWMVRPELLARS